MNLTFGVFTSFVQLLYSLAVLCSFALQLFPLLEVIESAKPGCVRLVNSLTGRKLSEDIDIKYSARYALIAFAWLAGIMATQINTVLELSGSVFASILVYILVPSLYLKHNWGRVGMVRLAVNISLMIAGAGNVVYGLYKHI
jgi:hypothetical protein